MKIVCLPEFVITDETDKDFGYTLDVEGLSLVTTKEERKKMIALLSESLGEEALA